VAAVELPEGDEVQGRDEEAYPGREGDRMLEDRRAGRQPAQRELLEAPRHDVVAGVDEVRREPRGPRDPVSQERQGAHARQLEHGVADGTHLRVRDAPRVERQRHDEPRERPGGPDVEHGSAARQRRPYPDHGAEGPDGPEGQRDEERERGVHAVGAREQVVAHLVAEQDAYERAGEGQPGDRDGAGLRQRAGEAAPGGGRAQGARGRPRHERGEHGRHEQRQVEIRDPGPGAGPRHGLGHVVQSKDLADGSPAHRHTRPRVRGTRPRSLSSAHRSRAGPQVPPAPDAASSCGVSSRSAPLSTVM
jgi:hypothetical protein